MEIINIRLYQEQIKPINREALAGAIIYSMEIINIRLYWDISRYDR
jgi:hypothetical protein